MADRNKALDKVLQTIQRGFGADMAVRLSAGGMRSEVKEVIPVGIEPLDRYVLGCGGLPVGRISEVFGDEGSGKTSFQLACIAAAQREGGIGIVADSEFALSEDRMATFGCDPEATILLQPNNMEEAINAGTQAMRAIPDGVGPNLFVWDSVAATPPKAELEGEAGDAVVGVRARLLNGAMRVWAGLATQKRVHIMLINQVRFKIGVMFGDPTTTPGGPAIKFAASVRLKLLSVKPIKGADGRTGNDVTFKAVKNKLTAPHREAALRLNFDAGWDNEWSTINHAKEMGVIKQDARVSEKTLAEARAALGWGVDGDVAAKKDE